MTAPAKAEDTVSRVLAIVARHGRLAVGADALAPEDDLYDAGMTSRAGVGVMLALEEEFGIEFPDEMLRRDVFQTVAAIARAVDTIAEDT